MRCQSLRAYLDKELGPLNTILMRLHVAACPHCRKARGQEPEIVSAIREDDRTPVPPGLREKLLEDALQAAVTARVSASTPRRRVLTLQRSLLALILLAVIAVIGLVGWPRQRGYTALAAVAEAMAEVKSAYLVITGVDLKTGERHRTEVWIKAPSCYRILEEGTEVVENGKRSVDIRTRDGVLIATIMPSKGLAGLEYIMPSLSLFRGEEAVDYLMKENDLAYVGLQPAKLPDGRKAEVIELQTGMGGKVLITVDKETGRLAKLEEYRKDGTLEDALERVEYEISIPDTLFEVQIPKDALVADFSADKKIDRQAMVKKLEAEGAELMESCGGYGYFPSYFHSGIKFETHGKTDIYYLPKNNAFYVLGNALVIGSNTPGFRKVIRDDMFIVPYPADIPQEFVWMQIDRPGGYRVAGNAVRIQNIGDGPLIITGRKRKSILTIQGKARVLPLGAVYQDQQVDEAEGIFILPERFYDIDKLDFGNLPAAEVESMKEYIRKLNKNDERMQIGKKLEAEGYQLWDHEVEPLPEGNEKGTPHPGLMIVGGCGGSGYRLYYSPKRNVYRVLGRIRFQYNHARNGFDRVIEDAEFEAPCPPKKDWDRH